MFFSYQITENCIHHDNAAAEKKSQVMKELIGYGLKTLVLDHLI